MSATPYVDVWHAVIGGHIREGLPRLERICMHPRDARDFEMDVQSTPHTRSYVQHTPRGLRLFNVSLAVERGVSEGWLILEAEPGSPGLTIWMHQFRCLVHEDCLRAPDLGIACMKQQRAAAMPAMVKRSGA